MECTTLLFRSSIELWEFQKIAKISTVYVNEPELILKGLFEATDIEFACLAFRARCVQSIDA
jgi:hypothetical protein